MIFSKWLNSLFTNNLTLVSLNLILIGVKAFTFLKLESKQSINKYEEGIRSSTLDEAGKIKELFKALYLRLFTGNFSIIWIISLSIVTTLPPSVLFKPVLPILEEMHIPSHFNEENSFPSINTLISKH